jgi:hypothetical protein
VKDLTMLRKLANGEEPYGGGPFDADHIKLYRDDARELVDELDRLRAALTAAADRLYRLAERREFTEFYRGDHVGDELRARRRYAVDGEAHARAALADPLD